MRFLSALLFLMIACVTTSLHAQPLETGDTVQEQAEENEKKLNRDPFDVGSYAEGDTLFVGELLTYRIGEEDTLYDIMRYFKLGFIELRAANQGVDAWAPVPGTEIILPSMHLLPRAHQEGIVINLAEMRLYYFAEEQGVPITFPIGIGREGLETPLGKTRIIRKVDGPSWHPTERMKKENPALPDRVPPGPSNPLGTHALYLGWPTFLIHGTNKPSGIGRRVSSGCIRMLPESIKKMFQEVPVDAPVNVVYQPVKAALVENELYLEVTPTGEAAGDIDLIGRFEKKDWPDDLAIPDGLKHVINTAMGGSDVKVDWDKVKRVYREKRGYPIVVGHMDLPENEKAVAETKQAIKPEPVEAALNDDDDGWFSIPMSQPQIFNH